MGSLIVMAAHSGSASTCATGTCVVVGGGQDAKCCVWAFLESLSRHVERGGAVLL